MKIAQTNKDYSIQYVTVHQWGCMTLTYTAVGSAKYGQLIAK